MLASFFKKMDRYDRATRLYPAMLCAFPVLWISGLDFFAEVESMENANLKFASIMAVVGVAFVAGVIQTVRNLGNNLQDDLYAKWGGVPSTIVLRHRDNTFGDVTKKELHGFISSKIGIKAPTEKSESQNFRSADGFYEAGTLWLRNNTRDKEKFPLLFNDLIYYGFFRNCRSLKYFALAIVSMSVSITLFRAGVTDFAGFSTDKAILAPKAFWISVAVQCLAGFFWIFLITEKSVRGAAFTYAKNLATSFFKQ